MHYFLKTPCLNAIRMKETLSKMTCRNKKMCLTGGEQDASTHKELQLILLPHSNQSRHSDNDRLTKSFYWKQEDSLEDGGLRS